MLPHPTPQECFFWCLCCWRGFSVGRCPQLQRTIQTFTDDAALTVYVQTHSTGRSSAEALLLSWSTPPLGFNHPTRTCSSFISESPKVINGNSVLKNGGSEFMKKITRESGLLAHSLQPKSLLLFVPLIPLSSLKSRKC